MLFPGGFTFPNFVADVFAVFMFMLWFYLLIVVCSDLFRRRDVSGLGKVLWLIILIVLPISASSPIFSRRTEAWPSAMKCELSNGTTNCVIPLASAPPMRLKSSGG